MKILEVSWYLKLDLEMISLTISVSEQKKKKKGVSVQIRGKKSFGGGTVEIHRQHLNQ